jgi:hypothetical protein
MKTYIRFCERKRYCEALSNAAEEDSECSEDQKTLPYSVLKDFGFHRLLIAFWVRHSLCAVGKKILNYFTCIGH